ncbi:MAG: iron-containing alcohol dehydrogenase [bacterium]|nr:iron-containing alcohol dehydrogenase [bacterium]
MRNFTFYNPTRIEFGKGKENNIGNYIKEHGYKKVLVLYGSERIKRNGLFERVSNSLKQNDIEFVEVGGVVSNPLLSKVNEAIGVAKESNVDSVLAVGGGSVLDSVKAIAAGAKYEGDVWDFFIGKAVVKDALPLFSIMTLAATGSEMNQYGVVTHDETKEKPIIMSPMLFPKVSVVNPELMATVTKDYLAYSAVDIFAHCLDLYFSAAYLPDFNKALIENILRTVVKTTEILLENAGDYDARAEFAWASTVALNGLTFSGAHGNTYDTHMIEHAMSALFNVAHGAGLAVVLPAWMKWHNAKNPAQYERFAKEVFGVAGVKEGIDKLEAWFKKNGAPVTLEEAKIPGEAISDLADNAYGLAKMWGLGELYSTESIAEILELA